MVERSCIRVGAHHSKSNSVCCKKEVGLLCLFGISGLLFAQHRILTTYHSPEGKVVYFLTEEDTETNALGRSTYPFEGRTCTAKEPWVWILAKQS